MIRHGVSNTGKEMLSKRSVLIPLKREASSEGRSSDLNI
jgi:hypothetical protein